MKIQFMVIKKYRAFTLIELLVVVAIIGILAAVGVVAYNGYTGAAKEKAAKANHSIVMKYIIAENSKCELGELTVMDGNLTCSGRTTAKILKALDKTLKEKIKNPFDNNIPGVCGNAAPCGSTYNYGSNNSVGVVVVGDDADKFIRIGTCYKVNACSKDKYIENYFQILD